MDLFRTNSLLLILTLPFFNTELIIIKYENVGSTYIKRADASDYRQQREDPILSMRSNARKVLCDEVIMSKVFIRFPVQDTMPDDESSTTPVDLDVVNYLRLRRPQELTTRNLPCPYYGRQRIHLGARHTVVRVLPCVITDEKNWYVTFGFKERELFLVERVRSGMSGRGFFYLKMTGIIEPLATFSVPDAVSLSLQQQSLENQLLHDDFMASPLTIPRSMKLRCLHTNDYIRICSSVFATISTPQNGYLPNDARNVNYVRGRIRDSTKYFRLGSHPHVKRVRGDMIGCSVNQRERTNNFHILADLTEQDAVFVFVNGLWGENEVYFVGQVKQVRVLREVREWEADNQAN